MSENDEIKQILKKLISVLSTMSETLQTVENKINLSNRQIALLSKQVEAIASKIKELDVDIEEEFLKLGKVPHASQIEGGVQSELKKIENELESIPDELLDDELKQLLKEENSKEKGKSTKK
ncbi:MAG: hypothetical protein ACTSYB_09220 [Candidatus Helarchaeota archaeon]